MLIDGRFTLKGNIQEIWDFLLDPHTLSSCIPGAEKIQFIDDKTYECVVKQKVGPITVNFKFTTTLTEINEPIYLKAVGKGADVSKLGTFSQETTIELKEVSNDEVEIAYRSVVNVVGRLATFGERIMMAKAKDVGDGFARNLQQKLEMRSV